jgi:c-di-GMP-binding flagellar brake protein YcgR
MKYLVLAICMVAIFIILYLVKNISPKQTKVLPKRPNRRSAFRLSLLDQACWFHDSNSEEPVYKGSIRDISITGMKLHSSVELPVINEISVEFDMSELFVLTGSIERRKLLDNDLFEYGIHFHQLDPKTEQRLFKVLWEKSKEKVVV